MSQKITTNKTKTQTIIIDTLEKLSGSSSPRVDLGQFFGNYETNYRQEKRQEEKRDSISLKAKQEVRLFNYQEELVKKQIKELTELIKKEIELIKKANVTLLAEVSDISKITVESLPEKPGIYHVRFLELVLKILQALRAKVSESKTWLQALISRKKKRGSLFLFRSKKHGTQYSLSQELQTARSVQ